MSTTVVFVLRNVGASFFPNLYPCTQVGLLVSGTIRLYTQVCPILSLLIFVSTLLANCYIFGHGYTVLLVSLNFVTWFCHLSCQFFVFNNTYYAVKRNMFYSCCCWIVNCTFYIDTYFVLLYLLTILRTQLIIYNI